MISAIDSLMQRFREASPLTEDGKLKTRKSCRIAGCLRWAAMGSDTCGHCRDQLAALEENQALMPQTAEQYAKAHEEGDAERWDGMS